MQDTHEQPNEASPSLENIEVRVQELSSFDPADAVTPTAEVLATLEKALEG